MKKKKSSSTPFAQAKILAAQAVRNSKQLDGILRQALQKAKKLPHDKGKWDNLFLMIRLVQAHQKRRYRSISKSNLHLILSAIVYFVSPDDWIPDDLPFGLLDDAIVIQSVAAAVEDDLQTFFLWEKKT
ncbi:MAG: YkvA family protein [Verrucomicrobiota bacterium]